MAVARTASPLRALLVCLILAVGVLAALLPPAAGGRAEAAAAPPNVVFVMLDDATADTMRQMPATQSLVAQQGVTLDEFIYNQPLCCPSRATMLRGQYGQNTGVTSSGGTNGGYGAFYRKGNEASTLATWLDAAGYTTGHLGQYLVQYAWGAGLPDTHVPAGWDRWFATFDDAPDGYDYRVNDDGTMRQYGTATTDYLTDVLADEAVKFLQSATGPFYLEVAPRAPHLPATPAPRHATLFGTAKAPRSPSFDEADVSDKPAAISSLPLLTSTQQTAIDREYRKRLRSQMAVDDMVKRIVDTLRAAGNLGNTYVVVGSDNGYQLGEHRIDNGKNVPYEESLRTALYARGPGIPAGGWVSQQVGNVDVPVTFAAMAGVTPPSFVDGRSFLPLAQGATVPWRQTYLLGRGGSSSEKYAGLRTSRYTYVEYNTGEREFYDRQTDPYQLTNTYATMDPALRTALQNRLAALKVCKAADCRRIEELPL
jgi:N-acetylglucosamine-6-sulfatase